MVAQTYQCPSLSKLITCDTGPKTVEVVKFVHALNLTAGSRKGTI